MAAKQPRQYATMTAYFTGALACAQCHAVLTGLPPDGLHMRHGTVPECPFSNQIFLRPLYPLMDSHLQIITEVPGHD